MPAIFNKVWAMNSIAFCYLHPCYVCCEAMTGVATAEDKLKNSKSFSRSLGNVWLLSELGESVQQYTATVMRSRDVDQTVINIQWPS
jgi:hypothetical protein